eukprot:COSAG01_NODE_2310_length_7942_cov_7.405330_6_plen_98_part_00
MSAPRPAPRPSCVGRRLVWPAGLSGIRGCPDRQERYGLPVEEVVRIMEGADPAAGLRAALQAVVARQETGPDGQVRLASIPSPFEMIHWGSLDLPRL